MWICSKCNSDQVLGGKFINIPDSDIFKVMCPECVQPERLSPEDHIVDDNEMISDSLTSMET